MKVAGYEWGRTHYNENGSTDGDNNNTQVKKLVLHIKNFFDKNRKKQYRQRHG